MVKKLKLNESETKTLNALMRAVQNRIDELEDESMDECLTESEGDTLDFDGYDFNPNATWNEIFRDVIEPIIDDHYNNIGRGYTQEEAEDDIDAIINMFMDEYGDEYPNVKKACLRFFDNEEEYFQFFSDDRI